MWQVGIALENVFYTIKPFKVIYEVNEVKCYDQMWYLLWL